MSAFLKRCLVALPLLLGVATAQAHLKAGDTPPDLLGETRNGEDIHVGDMHGKVVVVAFWASWCKYCQQELPKLASIQKLVSPQQLQVIAINQDNHDTFRKLSRELAKVTPDVVYTFDHGSISKAFGVSGIPHTVLIDRDGKVAYVHVGYADDMLDGLADEINSLLATSPQTVAAKEGGGS